MVQFPRTRISVSPNNPALDTQVVEAARGSSGKDEEQSEEQHQHAGDKLLPKRREAIRCGARRSGHAVVSR